MLPAILDWAEVLLVLVCFNIGLGAVKQILEKIMDRTSSNLDNQAHGLLDKYLPWLQRIIDWISGNLPHKK